MENSKMITYQDFDISMKALTGMTSMEFRHKAGVPTRSADEMHLEWIDDGWILSFDADDPQYKLDKVVEL